MTEARKENKKTRLKYDSGSMILDCGFLLSRVCVVRSLPLNPSAFATVLTVSELLFLLFWFLSPCCLFLISFKQRSTTVTWSYKHVRRKTRSADWLKFLFFFFLCVFFPLLFFKKGFQTEWLQ